MAVQPDLLEHAGKPIKRYPLEIGGPIRVHILWNRRFTDTRVIVDGLSLLTVHSRAELREGRSVDLQDGSRLGVKLARAAFFYEFQVTRNGFPLPDSDSHPETILKSAYRLIFFIAGMSILFGLAATLSQAESLQQVAGPWSVGTGIVLLLLGLLVRKRSAVALGLVIGLLVLDALSTLADPQASLSLLGIITRVFFLAIMARGFGAIRVLKERERQLRMADVF